MLAAALLAGERIGQFAAGEHEGAGALRARSFAPAGWDRVWPPKRESSAASQGSFLARMPSALAKCRGRCAGTIQTGMPALKRAAAKALFVTAGGLADQAGMGRAFRGGAQQGGDAVDAIRLLSESPQKTKRPRFPADFSN